MKLKDSGVMALAVVVFFFIGPNTCIANQELEDITTIVGDTAISYSDVFTVAVEDADQILFGTSDPLQDQTPTQYEFELANNSESEHFENRHQFIPAPEPTTLLFLTFGGLCLLRRSR